MEFVARRVQRAELFQRVRREHVVRAETGEGPFAVALAVTVAVAVSRTPLPRRLNAERTAKHLGHFVAPTRSVRGRARSVDDGASCDRVKYVRGSESNGEHHSRTI